MMRILFTLSSVLWLSMVHGDHANGDLPIEKPPILDTGIPESERVKPDNRNIIIIEDPTTPPPLSTGAIGGAPSGLNIDPATFLAGGGVDIERLANLDPKKLNDVLNNVLTTVQNELRNTETAVDHGTTVDQGPTVVQGAPSSESSSGAVTSPIASSDASVTDTRTEDQKQIDNILQTLVSSDANSLVKSDGLEQPALADLMPTPADAKPDIADQIAKEIQSAAKAFGSDVGSVDTSLLPQDIRNLQNTLRSSPLLAQQQQLGEPTLNLPETSQDDEIQKGRDVLRQLESERIAATSQPTRGSEFLGVAQIESPLNNDFNSDDARKLTQLIERRRELLRLLREQEQRAGLNTATSNAQFARTATFRNINRAATIDDFGNSLDDIPSISSPLVGNSIGVDRNIITDSENQRNARRFDALVEAGRVNAPEDIRQRFSDDDGQVNRLPPISRLRERTGERPGVGSARNFIGGAMRSDPNLTPGGFLLTDNSIQTGNIDDSLDNTQATLLQQQRNALLTRRRILEERLSRLRRPGPPFPFRNNVGFRPPLSPRVLQGIRRGSFDDGNIRRIFNQQLGRRFDEDDNRIRFTPRVNALRRTAGDRLPDDDNITPPIPGFNPLREQRSLLPSRDFRLPSQNFRLPSQNFRLPFQRDAFDDREEALLARFQGPFSDDRREARLTRFIRRGQSPGLSGFSSRDDFRFVDTTPRRLRNRGNIDRLFTRRTASDFLAPRTSLQSSPVNIQRPTLSPTFRDSDDDSNPPPQLDNVGRQPSSTGREQQTESNSIVTPSFGDYPDFNRQVEQLFRGASGFNSVSFSDSTDDHISTSGAFQGLGENPDDHISIFFGNQGSRGNPRRVAISQRRQVF